MNRYPDVAGHQGGDTDRQAAHDIERSGRRRELAEKVYAEISRSLFGMTADEVALAMREDVLSVRPRLTELKERGLLIDTGIRRLSSRGKPQRVLAVNGRPRT